MILKTKVPGRLVQRRKRKQGGGHKVVPWFRFDDKGFAELDETKLDAVTIQKLKQKFEVVESKADIPYKELQKAYTKATGKTGVGKKTKDMLKELEVL